MKCLLKSLGQILGAPVFVLKSGRFWHTYLGGNCAPFPTPSSPDEVISAIPIKLPFEQKKEMTFDGRLPNARAPVVRNLYCRSSQTWHLGIGEEDFAGAGKFPPLNWMVVFPIDRHWGNRRSATCARSLPQLPR